jgi:hypothetical protein
MSYQEKCEKLHRDNQLMLSVLNNISDMKLDISELSKSVRDIETIKSVVKTVLSVVDK